MTEPAIRVQGLSRRFGTVVALDGCDLAVPAGTVATLLGPSGSGKTTMLRLVAGFDRPDTGSIDVSGQRVVDDSVFVPPERRRVGVVFQDYALFPHLDVAANVGYGLARRTDRTERIGDLLELVGMEGLQARFPHELSGGQQQRVALARALAPRPSVIVLDEPFSNLDAALRAKVRAEVLGILRAAGTTAIFITHDQEEALSMSDLVAVMEGGRVVQVAPPQVLYRQPVNEWVGSFLGDANFLPGTAVAGRVVTSLGEFPSGHDGRVRVMVRPESIRLSPPGDRRAVVLARQYFGHDQLVTVALDDGTVVRARTGPERIWLPGDEVDFRVDGVVSFPGAAPDPPVVGPSPTHRVASTEPRRLGPGFTAISPSLRGDVAVVPGDHHDHHRPGDDRGAGAPAH